MPITSLKPMARRPFGRRSLRSRGLGDSSTFDIFGNEISMPDYSTLNVPDLSTLSFDTTLPQPVMTAPATAPTNIFGQIGQAISGTSSVLMQLFQAQQALNTAQSNANNAGAIANAQAAAQINQTLGLTRQGTSPQAPASSLTPLLLVGGGLIAVIAVAGGRRR